MTKHMKKGIEQSMNSSMDTLIELIGTKAKVKDEEETKEKEKVSDNQNIQFNKFINKIRINNHI
jgi:hypothetical protein